ncbi:alpha/beta hydrolase [Catellatospora tritici]|uniref:alpha/beta hydrolase n=1 Tax=Catellatospora tritici TaxID=2851566 RepID=UPI0020C3144E|nr:alpha/beta hydrolase-fold protein [Catellatospora tritici]
MGDAPSAMSALVLLHGYGDDREGLLALADLLSAPQRLVVVPEAPQTSPVGGRQWWPLDSEDRPTWAWHGTPAATGPRHRQVDVARARVLELLTDLRHRYDVRQVSLAGFSQGGMLALDVALAPGSGVAKVAALSAVLLADTERHVADGGRPRILLAHGELDDQVPFAAGESTRDILAEHGHTVDWLPFTGGHDIPDEVVWALTAFLDL